MVHRKKFNSYFFSRLILSPFNQHSVYPFTMIYKFKTGGWKVVVVSPTQHIRSYEPHHEKLSSETVQANLCRTRSELPKTVFLASRLICRWDLDLKYHLNEG